MSNSVVIIGAGIGGLAAAIALAARGTDVTVLEQQRGAGGKMLAVELDGETYDSGPTVLTMKWVFELLFEKAGVDFATQVAAAPLPVLARHFWLGGHCLDLFADRDATVDAIEQFAGAPDADGYRRFAATSRRIHDTLREPFLKSQKPMPWDLAFRMKLGDLLRINPFESYWDALQKHFKDARLRQLFGRYATYCGTSPFKAPATLMLVADVEAQGVWRVAGGMAALATALEALARKLGVRFLFKTQAARFELRHGHVESVIDDGGNRHPCTAAVVNADAEAVANGLLGQEIQPACKPLEAAGRSLSAITWCIKAKASGPALEHHTVFFSGNCEQEFAELERGTANDPTVYLCDQGDDRKLLLINAPAGLASTAHEQAETALRHRLAQAGLALDWPPGAGFRRGPQDFAKLYPATQGALYGRASNGWMATFQRPQARTRIPGLYLAGGSVHPGPGVPMAALSGLLAAEALLHDRALTKRYH